MQTSNCVLHKKPSFHILMCCWFFSLSTWSLWMGIFTSNSK